MYAPLSEKTASQGVDLLLLGLILLGTSSILGSINFLTTIFKLRAPGMTLLRMPMFVWANMVTSVLLLFSLPVLTAGLIMLFIDRNYGGGFFDPAQGGNPILWQHVFWFFGHPEVYVLILPAFGIVSEIVPVFSRKPLFGYRAFVLATASIGALGFTVWAHHMFTTGRGLPALLQLLHVPHRGARPGIKFFNWLATMWGGKIKFDTPMLFACGFIALFLIGGLDGAFLAVVPFDFMVQDTYWVVSHIHYVLVAGAVFGIFAALYYWFPKMTGRMLNERLGKINFWLLFIGTNVTFFPQHLLGLDGMIRRIADYSPNAGWTELNFLSVDRRLHHRGQHPAVPVERVHHAAPAAGRAGRPVGRLHPGVGDHQPAAGLQLRLAAADPLRAPALRPEARRGRGGAWHLAAGRPRPVARRVPHGSSGGAPRPAVGRPRGCQRGATRRHAGSLGRGT